MRNIRSSLLVAVLLACGAMQLSAQTVISWNLEWFPGRSSQNVDPAVAAEQMACAQQALRDMNPDVFIGIELRNREVFQELISAVPGMQVAAVSAFRDDDGRIARQQIGIASKYPVNAAWSESWQATMSRLPRGFTLAALREPRSGKLLVVYGVHFKSNRAINERETALDIAMRNEASLQLAQDVNELSRLVFPTNEVLGWILAGDFNTNHDGKFGDHAIRTLQNAGFYNTWKDVPQKDRQTWKGDDRFEPTTFDYIMTSGLGEHAARMLPSAETCSDHHPVLVELGSPPAAMAGSGTREKSK